MIVFRKKDKIKQLDMLNFKLERELQNFIEENLKEIFQFEFLATEYAINNFRFDTLAYDRENNTFTIIEYKRGKNESLVDQGLAYLSTLLDRRSDIVLLFNKVFEANKQIEDFEWDLVRVYFVSTQFTEFQRAATSFKDMPFLLFEVKRFEGDLYVISEVLTKSKNTTPKVGNGPVVPADIKVYTEDYHKQNIPARIIELYDEVRDRLLEFDNVEVKAVKNYIAFKVQSRNIVDIKLQRDRLVVYLNVPLGKLDDPYKKTRDVSVVSHHGSGDYSFRLAKRDDIDYLLTLAKQSYIFNA